MFNRKKISHSVDQKSTNKKAKIKDLSTWINNYEIQAYATEEMKKEIKELLLEVYNYDKDIRDYFFKKYISMFSDILNLKSNPRDIDCIFKEDISYDLPEKTEFKKFIENRNNKILEEEEKSKKKKYTNSRNNFWSEDKKFKNNIEDDESEYNYKNNKRNKDKKEYLSEQKRNNSKIRDYAKTRFQLINKYNDIFENYNDNVKKDNSDVKVNEAKEQNNLMEKNKKDIYYAYKNPSMINFRQKNNRNKNKNTDINKKSLDYTNIPRLLLINKNNQNNNREVKIYSLNNIKPNNQREIKTFTYQKKFNSRYNTENNNNSKLNNSEIKIEKELYKDNNLTNVKSLKKEDLKNIYNNLETNEDSFHRFSDEFSEGKEDEIKKINISGVNYKISGYGPKKVEMDKEIVYNNYLKDKDNINDNKKTNTSHKKITMMKNLEEDKTQKIEKDIKTIKTIIRNINIPKDAYVNREIGKKINEIFKYNGKDQYSNYYEVSLVKEDKTFGIDPYLLNNIFKKKKENNNSNINNKHISYNERRKRKIANKTYSNNKKRYFDYNTNYNKENKNIDNNENENNNKINEARNELKDYRYKYNTYSNINVNKSNGMNNEEKFKVNNINIIERKSDEKYNNKQQFNEAKGNDYKGINGSSKNNIFGNKRKRFHRAFNSEIF